MMKFYKCDICGKIIAMVNETAAETVCCGAAMHELVPNTTDGKYESHVPVYTVDGNTTAYKYYKIVFTANGGDGSLQLSEIALDFS